MNSADLVRYFNELKKENPIDNTNIVKDFNDLFVETGLFEKYSSLNKSHDTYKDLDGWANALLHYKTGTKEDWDNFLEWVDCVIKKVGEEQK